MHKYSLIQRARSCMHVLFSRPAAALSIAVATALTPIAIALPDTAAHAADNPYLVGAGAADITGEPAEVGFMGYGDSAQKGSGIHTRQYARVFLVVDPSTSKRNVVIVLDALSSWQSLRDELVRRIQAAYPGQFGEENIMVTASHTHATPGGISHHMLFNVTTLGFHPDTFNAQVEGSMKALDAATKDLAPGNVTVSRSSLTQVGRNRSMAAYTGNREELRRQLVNGVDPTDMTLRLERNGTTRAVINWFAIHPTSLTTKNTLVSSDNKGYAQYLLEHDDHGVDRNRAGSGDGFIAAFANSNAGDVTPNTNLRAGSGPTDDQFQNVKIQGAKQANAVRSQLRSAGTPVGSGLDGRIAYFDMVNQQVDARFTGTGRAESTCSAFLGVPFARGSEEDGGGGLPIFHEGQTTQSFLGRIIFAPTNAQRACQSPKGLMVADMNGKLMQTVVPVQIMRFGTYYILGLPGEMTGAVGAQYRLDAAQAFGVDPSHIIVQGYTNAYTHYVTTTEEYWSQQYEGGVTLFGPYTMAAYRQSLAKLAESMKQGTSMPLGSKPWDPHPVNSLQGKVVYDKPVFGLKYGQVTVQPQDAYAGAQEVRAEFVGAHPNNDMHHDSSYFVIEKYNRGRWEYFAGDNHPDTFFEWKRVGVAGSKVTVRWVPPKDAQAGRYRIRYTGDAKVSASKMTSFEGVTRPFQVMRR